MIRTLGEPALHAIAPGPVDVADDEPFLAAPPLLQRGKPLALLIYCTTERRRSHSREALSALLWADAAPDRARHNLRQALWRVRRLVGDLLVTRNDEVLRVESGVETDREKFLDAVARQDYTEALALYRGPFLQGLSLPGGDEFDDWVTAERNRLEEALLRVVEQALHAEPPRIRPSERKRIADQLVARAPDAMDARRLAVELLIAAEDSVGARREADALEAWAVREGRALSQSTQLVVARARASEHAEDTGEGDGLLLEMVGRDEPFAKAMSAWAAARRGEFQLLLLTGEAGVGKTRLLRAIAERCDRRGNLIVQVRAHPGEQMAPWSLVVSIAQALCSQPGAGGISGGSAAELVRLDPSLARHFPTSTGDGSILETADTARRRALALLDLMQAVAEEQPVALLLDDLHWMDHASRDALNFSLARVGPIALFVVGACRGDGSVLEHPTLDTRVLLPLEVEAVLETVRSSGVWPAGADVGQFLHTLAGSCGGNPLALVERLTLAMDEGLLALHQRTWSSPDWAAATREVARASPVTRRLRGCSEAEREVLLTMAVAGTPLPQELLGTTEETRALLARLAAKGFVRMEHGRWLPVHDLLLEHLRAECSDDTIRAAHLRLARVLEQSRLAERLTLSTRHAVLGGDIAAAGTLFSQVVARARARNDQRNVRDLLADLVGEIPPTQAARIVSSVPWFHRVDSLGLRVLLFTALLVITVTLGVAWRVLFTPTLQIEQASVTMADAELFGDSAIRLVPMPIVRLTGSTRNTPPVVRVRSLSLSTDILSGDSAVVVDSLARFGGLRLRPRSGVVQLSFEAEGFRPATMVVKLRRPSARFERDAGLRLLDGRFTVDGRRQRVGGDSARLEVPVNALIEGVIQFSYSATWPAASVWVAMTPTWGDPESSGRELQPLTTPVHYEVVDLPITVLSPARPGRYWILVVIGAEPSGGYLLSNTNWLLETPMWGDGNDLASLPDSLLERSRALGEVNVDVAYPSIRRVSCPTRTDPMVAYCRSPRAMLAIEVIAK